MFKDAFVNGIKLQLDVNVWVVASPCTRYDDQCSQRYTIVAGS